MARSVASSPPPSGYEFGFHLGSGGMATVHYGRRVAAGGFAHSVAIKELHPHLAARPDVLSSFLDEARLAARVVHPNVVSVLDVVSQGERVWAIMQYIEGEPLGRLVARAAELDRRVPVDVAVAVTLDLLAGLEAAHCAKDERGDALGIVHRDVSPQNILVGTDGVARVLDFGVAKARGRLHETRDGQVKGKLAYMAPEQLGGDASPGTDVYAAAIVLWELLAGRRLFTGANEVHVMTQVLAGAKSRPSDHAPVPAAIDAVVARALALDPRARFSTATQLADALRQAADHVADRAEIAAWVSELSSEALAERRARIANIASTPPPPMQTEATREDLAQTIDPVVATVRLPAPPPAPRTRRTWPAMLAAAIVALGLSLVVAVSMPSTFPSLGGARLESGALTTRALAARPIVAPPPSAEAPRADTEPPAAPALQSPPPHAAKATTKRAKIAPRRHKPVRAPVAPPSASAQTPLATTPTESCDPPFVVDAAGVRHYKRACIR